MACFTYNWDNTEVLANDNNTGQNVYYREAGEVSWISHPDNPFETSDNTAEICSTSDNIVYEFKVESTCEQGGPTPNDNGIIEYIGFSCVDIEIDQTHNTCVATVDLSNTDITKVRFTLRKSSDNSIAYGPITVNKTSNQAMATATGLTAATSYYWQFIMYATVGGVEIISSQATQLNTVCGPYTFSTEAAPVENLIWVALSKSCEKEGGFGVVKTITGLSSPLKVWYDEENELVYVADQDDTNGNVYWFNPDTATVAGDMIHSSAIDDNTLYNAHIDTENRKIYFVGGNSGGLKVYDIDTDTVSTVAFGTNGAFSRTLLVVAGNNIYCNDGGTSIIIIDRTTLVITDTVTIGGIPTPSHFDGGALQLIPVGSSELYAVTSNGTNAKIGVYNLALDTLIAEITLPGAAVWDFGKYWQGAFYDDDTAQVYVSDIGSSKLYTIDADTKTVTSTRTASNKEGKTNVGYSFLTNPITGDLYIGYSGLNNSADSNPIQRFYLEDKVAHTFLNMYEDQFYQNASGIPGTPNVVGSAPGLGAWSGSPTADEDGTITIVSTTIGSSNNGNQLVNTLQQVDANNGNEPTGETKNNVVGGEDYIEPNINLTDCPVTVNTVCPENKVTTFLGTILNYEFALAQSVVNNPAVAKMEIYAYNTDTALPEGSPVVVINPSLNYYSGSFTGLGGTNYDIEIRFLGSGDAIIQTCLPII